jgi:stearoyl-CoA desaturase (delta-9 desaturase)
MSKNTASVPENEKWLHWGITPFVIMHILPFFAFFTGTRVIDWVVLLVLYYVRMFGITAGFHRYFAHRAYKMGRFSQFCLAFLGSMSAQKGVLWWAGHHRHHHKYSDMENDIHSPLQRGFWWSHVGWILAHKYDETPFENIQDFAAYPELRWLNKYWLVAPISLAVATFVLGGWSMLLIGFFLSTVLLYHGTFTINSLSHVFGWRRFATTDTSRNNPLLAFITLGEGWHNNHHHYQSSANQGFFWWEIDVSYYVIRLFGLLGLAWDIRTPTPRALAFRRIPKGKKDQELFGTRAILPVAPSLSDAE